MPTSQAAISNFLMHPPPPPPLDFRAAPRDLLLGDLWIGHPPLFKTPPYLHQVQGLSFALWAERCLLFYEMRTGKSKIALDWLTTLLVNEWMTKKALIITHAPIGTDVWQDQVAQHSHLNIACIRSGSGAREMFFYTLRYERVDAVALSWSTLQRIFAVPGVVTHGAKKGREKLYADRALLRSAAAFFDACVIDEIHMAGHHDTLRFTIASELVAGCRWRLGLTGTPFGRDPLLLWAQSYLIDGGEALGRSFPFFREAFCTQKYNRFKPWNNIEYFFDRRKLPVLRDKLQASTLHCALRDVQDVHVLKGKVQLTMSDEQAKAYDEAIDRLVQLKRGQTVEIDNVFVRLRQIASGFLPFENDAGETRILDFPDAAKFEWLADFLDDLPELQIVLMHEFIHTGERICKLLAERDIKHDWLRGGTDHRPELLERFRNGTTQVLVANTGTGGMSVDLSAADYLCFVESTPSVITRRQAEARPLARGDRPLVMDDLVCAPIEKKLLDYLEQGENLRDVLLRDPKAAAELRR